jgi:hypothetical protein
VFVLYCSENTENFFLDKHQKHSDNPKIGGILKPIARDSTEGQMASCDKLVLDKVLKEMRRPFRLPHAPRDLQYAAPQ